MKCITFEVIYEHQEKELKPTEETYTIFIEKEGALYPVDMPKALASHIPPWSFFKVTFPDHLEENSP